MKLVKNTLIVVLLAITIIQWIVISFLIVQKLNYEDSITTTTTTTTTTATTSSIVVDDGKTQQSKMLVEETTESSPKSDVIDADKDANVNESSTKDENTVNIDANKPTKYEGVAATLMINAPKWFQKRYSTMLSNIFANTPSNWAIQIFYIEKKGSLSQFGLNINPNLSRLNATNDRIIFTPIPQDLVSKYGERKKLLYWTDKWLWESLVADNVLVFNGNGVICSNAKLSLLDGSAYNELFKDLDYLGSPWRLSWGEGGDGSYSFRNRKAMLDALQFKRYDVKYGREDQFFINTLKKMNKDGKGERVYRVATKEQTHLFAGNLDSFTEDGNDPPPLPLVVSGTLPQLEHAVRQNVLSACPELGMMFPLLHHPSCFGANPDGKECSKHICALKDRSERKSGC